MARAPPGRPYRSRKPPSVLKLLNLDNTTLKDAERVTKSDKLNISSSLIILCVQINTFSRSLRFAYRCYILSNLLCKLGNQAVFV